MLGARFICVHLINLLSVVKGASGEFTEKRLFMRSIRKYLRL